ncbi:hypothetical protein BDZ89DRAFT_1070742 [Hymenopellis radicata]|nr:hypothetical protein BDZ89DRAFT_1070742 [Hymenopellis radicata]
MLCEHPPPETLSLLPLDQGSAPPLPLSRQLDLLFRLRIIEKLQDVSQPHINHQPTDDYIIDVLNWIASVLSENAEGDSVSVAFSAQTGRITLYIANNDGNPKTEKLKECVSSFLSTVRQILLDVDSTPEAATRAFLRMAVDIGHERIQRKIVLVAQTDEGMGQTAYHFTTLVSSWLVYRPEGELSRGFVSMAANYGGTPSAPTSLHIAPEERCTYLASIITACTLLANSTFFYDLINYHSFRLSLKIQDRIFLHKLLRRISRIAAYKNGAMQFAHLGLPFIRSVIGQPTTGVVDVTFISEADEGPFARTYRWPEAPAQRIPIILLDNEEARHSRHSSTDGSGVSSSSSEDSSSGCRSDLGHLDNQLRAELLQSELLTSAWDEGVEVHTKYHSELQLIHYLTKHDVDVAYQAFGTSKPVCWTCGSYIDHLPEGEDNKWWYSRGCSKVYHEWMIPNEATDEVIEALLGSSQEHMERIVEEVAFDCYY